MNLHQRAAWLAAALAAVGLSAWVAASDLAAQSSGLPTPAVSSDDIVYMQATLDRSLQALQADLNELQNVPDQVRQAVDESKQLRQGFQQAVQNGNLDNAVRRYRRATRLLSRVSQWLVQRADREDTSSLPPEERLPLRLKRMVGRLKQLSDAAQSISVALDFSTAKQLATDANTALANSDLQGARAALRSLRDELLALQDAYQDARDGAASSMSGGQ